MEEEARVAPQVEASARLCEKYFNTKSSRKEDERKREREAEI